MLALSRKVGESVFASLDDGQTLVKITVVRIEGNRVVLGFTAPADVTILRSELEPVKGENEP